MRSLQNQYFHTVNTLLLPDDHASLLPELDRLCRSYSGLWNHTLPGSDVWNINHAGGVPVSVSTETLRLLRICAEYRAVTDGAFNILAATVKHRIQEDPDLSLDVLSELSNRLAEETVYICDDQVLCPTWARIDFGSIAKGYVCDRLKEYLIERGVDSALIDLGGNIAALGNREDGSPWQVGIRNPFSSIREPLCMLEISDRSVVTSGMYERSLSFHGKTVHHIIDPETCLPCEPSFPSVSVISDHSSDADAYTTAITVMSRDQAEAFIRRESLDVLCVTKEGTLLYTDDIHPIFD